MTREEQERIAAAVGCIEARLGEPLDLATAAQEARYSKYHFHRLFAAAAGITPHSYIRRRRLTEAARRLVFSQEPVVEIALAAGYQSQQAFASVFRAMYKRTPGEYRKEGFFYPLQLPLRLREASVPPKVPAGEIRRVAPCDIPAWMELLTQVIDGFPRLREDTHRQALARAAAEGEALLLWDRNAAVGAAVFSRRKGRIELLTAHPQYRRRGVTRALLRFVAEKELPGQPLRITTFRAGDPADTGQWEDYRRLGFVDAGPGVQFGYPIQQMVLPFLGGAL